MQGFDRSVCFVQDLNYPIKNQDLAYIYVMSHAHSFLPSCHSYLAVSSVRVVSILTDLIVS